MPYQKYQKPLKKDAEGNPLLSLQNFTTQELIHFMQDKAKELKANGYGSPGAIADITYLADVINTLYRENIELKTQILEKELKE